MATHEYAPLLGKRIRVTELDSCGAVVTGAQTLATDGFVSVSLTAETEDGNEIIVRNASGQICINEKMANSFKRFTVSITFCGVNPELLALVTNAEVYEDWNEDPAGFTVPEGEIDSNFALELWTGLSGVACEPGQVDEASGYLLLPYIRSGILGDLEITGESEVTFSLTGAFTRGGNGWGTGHNNVVRNAEGEPAKLPTAIDPFDHLLLIDTALAPPPSASDSTTVTVPGTP